MNYIRIVRILFWSVVVLQLATQVTATASGQQVVMRRAGKAIAAQGFGVADGADDFKTHMESQLVQQKGLMEQRMAVRIDDLNQVCGLTPEQLQKLKIASKGAIEKSLTDFRQVMETAMQPFAVPLGPEGLDDPDEAENEPAEETPEGDAATKNAEVIDEPAVAATAQAGAVVDVQVDIQPMRQLIMAQPVFGSNTDNQKPEMQSIWKSTVEKTLTSDQSEKLSRVLAERTKQQIKAAVENFITKVDMELFLQPTQREKLAAWVQAGYGELLRSSIENPMPGFFFDMGTASDDGENQEVSAILTPAQLGIWNSKFTNELEMLKNNNVNAAGGGGAIRIFRN